MFQSHQSQFSLAADPDSTKPQVRQSVHPGTLSASELSLRRVSPASGRDGVVFASLTPSSLPSLPCGERRERSEQRGGCSDGGEGRDVVSGTLSASELSLRRVSPASGRDGVVFASLTPSPLPSLPCGERRERSAQRGGGGRRTVLGCEVGASGFRDPLCSSAALLASLPQAGETVWCSLRLPLFLFRLSRERARRCCVGFAHSLSSSVSPLRGETRAQRAERGCLTQEG